MICEIINPSDPYTLKTDDFLCAAIAIALLGRGKLGLRSLDDELCSPTLFGWDEWIRSQVGDENEFEKYITSHYDQMADILDTVLIGDAKHRDDIEKAIDLIEDSAVRRRYWEEYHDRHRSSMNDIGRAAKQLSAQMRERAGNKANQT